MLYGCATWTMRSQDFSSLRTAHHKLLLRIIGFRRKDRTGYKPLLYREVLERTGSNASKRQFGSANLGSPGPLSGKATQGFQSESYLGGWRYKGPSEEVDRRRRGWTAYRKISRHSGRSRAKAKDGSGSHSELLSKMDGMDDCCEERGRMAPGGREGSGSSRQRLATHGPSSIQHAAPARG